MPLTAHLFCFDGEDHTRHRALLTTLLTFKRLKANEEYLRGLVNRLIDGFETGGGCEIVTQFAHATSTYALSDIMGIPMAARAELLEMLDAPPSQLARDALHKTAPAPPPFLQHRFDTYHPPRTA